MITANTADIVAGPSHTGETFSVTGRINAIKLNRELPNGRGNAWAVLVDDSGSLDICLSYKVVAWARQQPTPNGVEVRVEGYICPRDPHPDMTWLVVEAIEVVS